MTACIHHAGVNGSLDKDSRDPTSIFIPSPLACLITSLLSVSFCTKRSLYHLPAPRALLSQSRITHTKEPFKTTKLHEPKLIFETRNTWSYNFPPAGRRQFIQRQKVCASSTVLPSMEGDWFHSQFSRKNLKPIPPPATGHLDAQNLRLIPPGLWGRGVLLSSFLYYRLKNFIIGV